MNTLRISIIWLGFWLAMLGALHTHGWRVSVWVLVWAVGVALTRVEVVPYFYKGLRCHELRLWRLHWDTFSWGLSWRAERNDVHTLLRGLFSLRCDLCGILCVGCSEHRWRFCGSCDSCLMEYEDTEH